MPSWFRTSDFGTAYQKFERYAKILYTRSKSWYEVFKKIEWGIQKTGTHNILDNLNDNIDDKNTFSGESIVWECVINEECTDQPSGQSAPTHDRASCTDGKGNLSQAIPDTTTEITNQRIHTKTLSGERAVRVLPPSPEKFKNIPKMRISLFELVLCPSLNFIR